MTVTQMSIGRFHHFHLARQMERHQLLDKIYTGYPRYKLKDELGIQPDKIHTFPWFHAPYMALVSKGIPMSLNNELRWIAGTTLDRHVKSRLKTPTTIIALSGQGLWSGEKAQKLGGKYICDRGSSHIQYQDDLLKDEYRRFGLKFPGVDKRIIERELLEYDQADKIFVPSEFVRNSFIERGIPSDRLAKIPYGARLERFSPSGLPSPDVFRILWVGSVSLRKGFPYLLEAFQKFKHPRKELIVVGEVTKDVQTLLPNQNLDKVVFKGSVPNTELAALYSSSHVFVLPSIEEGLAMVQGEALACGCPVIATRNSGSEDIFTDGVEGFIVPIRSSTHIVEKLDQLALDRNLQQSFSNAASARMKAMGGWNTYGDNVAREVKGLYNQQKVSAAFN